MIDKFVAMEVVKNVIKNFNMAPLKKIVTSLN